MNYKEAYKTIEEFVNKNEFEGSDLLKEIFSDVNKEINTSNENIINGMPKGHKERGHDDV